ncbi:hypothetical protein BDV25DRAFT_1061 [Aspergillus avenaceus]|uniref:Uncharacterized protein n=1 Tax=Aspergillus avenaceus TaxID=36643 RepID=A0A5N6U9V1_ASPAV|nr:hypothetical protein BDV25DRAFT_1061 [Aspergillus avenaceus]
MTAGPSPKPLRDLIRHHRELIVSPLLWTYRHLDLVGCRFEYADVNLGAMPDSSPEEQDLAEQLARNIFPVIKHRALVAILVGEGRPFVKHYIGSHFFFAGKPVHRPRYTVFHLRPPAFQHTPQISPPLIGYFHYTNVNGDRRRKFESCPDPRRRPDPIGGIICRKRLAQVTPPQWTEDPYFVCLLLALAQLQESKLKYKLTTYISRLLVVHVVDREYIYFYEAEITADLLCALRNPNAASSYTEWPTIRWRKIPYQPYETFANRLISTLVSPTPQGLHTDFKLSEIDHSDLKRSWDEESSNLQKLRRLSQ